MRRKCAYLLFTQTGKEQVMLQIFAQALLIATRMDTSTSARRQEARTTAGTLRKMPLNG